VIVIVMSIPYLHAARFIRLLVPQCDPFRRSDCGHGRVSSMLYSLCNASGFLKVRLSVASFRAYLMPVDASRFVCQ
jgi:hypothetical protein